MSITSVGSTQKFSTNWDHIFAGKRAKSKSNAKAKSKAKKKSALATAATSRVPKTKRAGHTDEPAVEIKPTKKKLAKKHPPAKPKPAAYKRKSRPAMQQRELF